MSLQRVDVEGITTVSSPYPSFVAVERLVFISGQVSPDGTANVVAEDDVAGQTRQTLHRLERILASAGAPISTMSSPRPCI